MLTHHGKPVAGIIEVIGATCAYAIILGMLVTAVAPLITMVFGD